MSRAKHLALISLVCLAACASPLVPAASQTSGSATLTPFGPASQVDIDLISSGRTPESVVQAFLTDVQEAPDQIHGYMSSVLKDRYPGTTVIDELRLEGLIEGFAIRSATSNEIMGLAYVTVGVRTEGTHSEVKFTLIKESNNWVISSLEVTSPE